MFRLFGNIKKTIDNNINFSTIFSKPEKHPEAKTLKDVYRDIYACICDIRNDSSLNPAEDEGFVQAATAYEKMLPITDAMESVQPMKSGELDGERIKLERTVGKNGLVDVTGPASRKFAEEMIKFKQAMIDKKYWAASDCPSVLGQSYLAIFVKDYYSDDDKKNLVS